MGQSKSEPMESGLKTSPLGVLCPCWARGVPWVPWSLPEALGAPLTSVPCPAPPTGTASRSASSTAAPASWPGLPSSQSWASWHTSRGCPSPRWQSQVSLPKWNHGLPPQLALLLGSGLRRGPLSIRRPGSRGGSYQPRAPSLSPQEPQEPPLASLPPLLSLLFCASLSCRVIVF